MVERLFLAVPRGCLRYVIVAYPDHTHLLFLDLSITNVKFSSKIYDEQYHTGQCKRTGGCYNELVVAFFSTGGGVKGKKISTC